MDTYAYLLHQLSGISLPQYGGSWHPDRSTILEVMSWLTKFEQSIKNQVQTKRSLKWKLTLKEVKVIYMYMWKRKTYYQLCIPKKYDFLHPMVLVNVKKDISGLKTIMLWEVPSEIT